MKRKLGIGALALASSMLVALAWSNPAQSKACEQLTGGACKGHWECTTDDGSKGYCADPPGTDCYCKKGKKERSHWQRGATSVQGQSSEPGPMNTQGQTHAPKTPPTNPTQPH